MSVKYIIDVLFDKNLNRLKLVLRPWNIYKVRYKYIYM